MDVKSSLVRTAIVTSLVTALVVSALAFFVGPKLMNSTASLQPATYNGDTQVGSATNVASAPAQEPQLQQRPKHRAYASAPSYSSAPSSSSSSSYEPTQHERSTGKSVAIVAGSAGTGAAIGALAGGGKGALIGGLAGGGAGLVYDRLTAHK